MRSSILMSLLLIMPWQQLGAQDAEPADDPSVQAEPEVILEPPDSQSATEESATEESATGESATEPAEELSAEAAAGDAATEEEAIRDVPGRVARLSLIEGDVVIAPAGTEELAEAVLNRPLTSGDRVLVDSGGRAELQIGNATLYLDGGTGLSLVELSDGALRATLTEGSAVIRVRRKQQDEIFELATPNLTVELLGPGEYSIAADPDGERTRVRTRSGEVRVSGEDEKFYRVRARQQGEFTGTAQLAVRITELSERTGFEAFANERERRDLESQSANYVSRDVIGYEDLDEHGEWIEEPEYGHIWRPRIVDPSWVPYRYGRWAFIAPWGWTWIDQARWGFAPFHYGRWAYLRSRWCWVPGPRRFRPVYAPALVGWTGRSTANVSIAFGGGVGWFPLGPREIFVPHYRYSRRYAHSVNVSNTVIINNTFINNIYRSGGQHGWRNGRQSAFLDYRYRTRANAVTLVQRDVFVGGRGIDGRFQRLDQRQWQRARHDGVPPAIDPQRSSLLAGRAVQRSGWQQRLARTEQAFGPQGRGFERSARRPAAVSNGERNRRWQDRGARAQRPPVNGFAPGPRDFDQAPARRWQERGQQQSDMANLRRELERRREAGSQSEPRRWQDRRGDQQPERRAQQGAGGQSEPRRWQDRPGDAAQRREQAGEVSPRRWQDRGTGRPEDPGQRRRWQERGDQDRSDARPRSQERRAADQSERRRWQGRGDEQRRQEASPQRRQDRGQRQPEQRRSDSGSDQGRRGWQQRSNDRGEQRSRGNGRNGTRWQEQ